ncbi:hypothetical protein LSH36_216g07063 [Paralvinella palmiformis]|uniref:RRM domain-containing protein n=1 Tax=Paralvinella palmiformis TaxID=53620 RepID=A0AAD9N621_9ANNE|nr:hypothetical protein LSH36_216g07063 [Paralvinella palmiformis]
MVTQSPPPYLVALFNVTAGQNGENLGSDEQQIVFFVYMLYDVSNNKVVALHHQYVRPVEDDVMETALTEECKIQTGLNEDLIKNAQPLDQVLDEFERFIVQKGIHPEHGVLTLDGVDQSIEYGIRHCQDMANIIQRLINDGHHFTEPEIIKDRLEPGICSRNDIVDDETVVRSRGLPWQSSDQDIARFFRGLNVEKGGVALCLSQQGRRNGEALVRFESKEHRDLALRKHKHHLGQRYIEVYRATGKDFVNVAGGSNTEAQVFLSRHSDDGSQVIVRMRGLPYSCSAQQVVCMP